MLLFVKKIASLIVPKSKCSLKFIVPGKNQSAYLQTISKISLLTGEEEQILARRLFYKNDLNAAAKLNPISSLI